jgi:hypothetical protein
LPAVLLAQAIEQIHRLLPGAESSRHARSSPDFTTTTSGFRFPVHRTPGRSCASTAFSEATLYNWKDDPLRLKIVRRREPASQAAPAGWGIKPRPPRAVPSGIGRSGRHTEQLIPHRGTFQGPAARLSSSGPPIPIPRSRFIGSRPRNNSPALTKPFSLPGKQSETDAWYRYLRSNTEVRSCGVLSLACFTTGLARNIWPPRKGSGPLFMLGADFGRRDGPLSAKFNSQWEPFVISSVTLQ